MTAMLGTKLKRPIYVEDSVTHIGDTAHCRMSNNDRERPGSASTASDADASIDGAIAAVEEEQFMGLWMAVQTYPKAIAWSVLASTAIISEAYDMVVIYGFFAFPAFAKKYGKPTPDGGYQVSAAWQTGLTVGASIGQMAGLQLTGIFADKYGQRRTMMGALVLLTCTIFVTFFAPRVEILLLGEILCGIPWGVFQAITPSYAAEVSPIALRPYLTSYINLCWVIGQMIGSGVLRGLIRRMDEWGYRIPFALQWIWPVPLIVGMLFAPESPWWLVRKGRIQEAEASVKRLTSRSGGADIDYHKPVLTMVHTNEMERQITAGTSYADCFRGIEVRRTEICCMVWMAQILCGGGVMAYSSYFMEQAGLQAASSFDLAMAQYGLGAIGVFTAWGLMPWVGRRTLYLGGQVIMMFLLLIVGFLGITPKSDSRSWATGGLLLGYTFVYDITVGPVCYSLVSEMSSTRLRQKTTVLARNAYVLTLIMNNLLTPHMLNPTAWDWGGKTGFFWAGVCFLSVTWAYFRLPEPQGRTHAELDSLFARRIPARKFASTIVTPFESHGLRSRHGSVAVVGAVKDPEQRSKTQ